MIFAASSIAIEAIVPRQPLSFPPLIAPLCLAHADVIPRRGDAVAETHGKRVSYAPCVVQYAADGESLGQPSREGAHEGTERARARQWSAHVRHG